MPLATASRIVRAIGMRGASPPPGSVDLACAGTDTSDRDTVATKARVIGGTGIVTVRCIASLAQASASDGNERGSLAEAVTTRNPIAIGSEARVSTAAGIVTIRYSTHLIQAGTPIDGQTGALSTGNPTAVVSDAPVSIDAGIGIVGYIARLAGPSAYANGSGSGHLTEAVTARNSHALGSKARVPSAAGAVAVGYGAYLIQIGTPSDIHAGA